MTALSATVVCTRVGIRRLSVVVVAAAAAVEVVVSISMTARVVRILIPLLLILMLIFLLRLGWIRAALPRRGRCIGTSTASCIPTRRGMSTTFVTSTRLVQVIVGSFFLIQENFLGGIDSLELFRLVRTAPRLVGMQFLGQCPVSEFNLAVRCCRRYTEDGKILHFKFGLCQHHDDDDDDDDEKILGDCLSTLE